MKSYSLRWRLITLFSLMVLLTWCIAASAAWFSTRNHINQWFDTQQILFAQQLASSDINLLFKKNGMSNELINQEPINQEKIKLPRIKSLLKSEQRGAFEDDALSFAIFSREGDLRIHDGNKGEHFIFHAGMKGFENTDVHNDDDRWRILWLPSADGRYLIAVGQELDYRNELIWSLIAAQLIPWLLAFPFLLLAIALLVTYALKPLHHVSQVLQQRRPDDASVLEIQTLPREIFPLVKSLNQLFQRTAGMLVRERRFTADAAHELRSPLAALRVQTEVAQLYDDDPVSRQRALSNLVLGIDRTTHLVEQLLTLSRLDSRTDLQPDETVNWDSSLQSVWHELLLQASEKQVALYYEPNPVTSTIQGQPLLLSLLLRNLLDNAIRYSPPQSVVKIVFKAHQIIIDDEGPGMTDEHLSRVGDRFYRPPGQQEKGSGLGLSIVQAIAQQHALQIQYQCRQAGGLRVTISWS